MAYTGVDYRFQGNYAYHYAINFCPEFNTYLGEGTQRAEKEGSRLSRSEPNCVRPAADRRDEENDAIRRLRK